MDCHQVVAAISRGEVLPEATVRQVATRFAEVLAEEGNLLHLSGPITIVGDVHGQFYDVQRVLQLGTWGVTQEDPCPTTATSSWGTTSTAATTPLKR